MTVSHEILALRDPSEEPDPRRAQALTLIYEDVRAARAGCTPLCAGCYKGIQEPALFSFRCADCCLPFHRRCLYEHFAKHGDIRAVEALLTGVV